MRLQAGQLQTPVISAQYFAADNQCRQAHAINEVHFAHVSNTNVRTPASAIRWNAYFS
ncbi:MAG: hypothetical protein ACUVSF_00390 [Anaerolineae bacterium]